jgi:hypothetical protein
MRPALPAFGHETREVCRSSRQAPKPKTCPEMAQPVLAVVRARPRRPAATERIWTAATPELKKAVEDYFYEHRFRNRSAAVRQLIELGLEHAAKKSLT